MDEELGVKVTRLRRRLSVESEDSTNSPSAPSTPKKRSTRLAAKPQLEHIEEDANENVPKNTRRQSVAREVADIAEEKVVTPARRSARIRSNTSLLADTTITAGTESPRAKRAARRISQLGSDTETPASPARQTRRTRKNSISSVDNPAGVTENNPDNVVIYVVTQENAPIPEETNTDTNKKETDNNEGETLSPNVRKSPRLTIKKGTVSENSSPNTKKQVDSDKTPALDKPNNENPAGVNQKDPEELSESSIDLLNQMAKDNTKVIVLLNKTTSAIDTAKGKKNKNKKNKSLTTLSDSTHEVDNFDKHNKCGGGDKVDSALNTSKEQNLNKTKDGGESGNKENIFSIKSQDSDAAKMLQKSPDVNIQPIIMIEDSDSNCGSVDKLVMDLPSESGDQCVPVVEHSTVNDTPKRNTVEPMDIDESIPVNVTIHDDYENANSSKEEAQNSSKTAEMDKNLSKQNSNILQFDTQKRKSALVDEVDSSKTNLSNRKSSINESIFEKDKSQSSITVENAVIEKYKIIETKADTSKVSSERMDVSNSSKRQSLANESQNVSTLDGEAKNTSNSKRKSSSSQESQNFENKSTLVISQLSTNETKSVANSPNITNNNLSKSLNVTELNNKNLDKKYSTSTPLQQKPLKKIRGLAGFGDSGKPINTSLMSPHIESKSVSKVSSKGNDSDSDSENDSSDGDNASKSKSKMSIIDDEASEASDDYESGDSRDSAEREYEDENNIVEKGETLDSDEEYSNDSDYDKDSFIVSSDEEDDEMLSGTGDDLSLSDNELKLTAKSKKKFDERKKKQQKNASKEMYDARHPNDSKNKPKFNRKRLESSSDSDEDDNPKKSNRLRIDSSQDKSHDGNEFLNKKKKVKPLSESICEDNVSQTNVDDSIVQKKKKVKRLSESVSEETKQNEETSLRKNKSKRLSQSLSQENADNEQEMIILNESCAGKKDPLSVSSIKLEPKTPQKDMNISTVPIVDNVEEIQLNANASIYQPNQTSDPLQETMDQDEDSSSSGNSEIMNNYNSVLENLNKQNKIKTLDHSLNINKEKGQKKEPIIDQLNLTQTKKIKNKKNKDEVTVLNTSVKKSSKAFEAQDDETSDSIDMRLLFPEDSNDSESNSSKVATEAFIPLRKSEAKTHIPEITNTSVGPNESLNTSKKKNKKRLSESITYDNDQNIETPFFIDSTGTHKDESQVELTSSSKKKKRNKNSISLVSDETESNIHDVVTEPENVTEEQINVSIKSDKKKKKKNRNLDVSQVEDSVSDTKTSEQLSTSFTADILFSNKDTSVAPNESLNTSKKKNKKRLSESVSQDDDKNIKTLFFNDTTGTYKDESQVELSNSSKKKKKKNKNSISLVSDETEFTVQDVVADEPENVTAEQANVSIKSDKKKKKKNKNLDMSQVEDSVNISIASDEKISKQLSTSVSGEMSSNKENITEEEVNVSIKSDKKKKKKNKNLDVSQVEDGDSKNVSSDKISKQLSTNVSGEISNNKDEDSEDDAPVEMTYQSEKRVEGTDLYVSTVPDEEVAQTGSKKFKKNKKKKKKATENAEDSNLNKRKLEEESGPSTLLEGNHKIRKIFTYPEDLPQQGKAVKKRKERDDDNVSNKTKVSKQNSSDKIHVPRLPDSVLSQLNDQPTPGIRAIATSQFVVEPSKRKNKPSNYLEQSVYLNDTPKKEKKSKHNKNPKVLPYLPTVTLSEEGYTSTFKINVLPNETEFVAHAANIVNFKNKLLKKNRNKKLGTLDRCKRQRMLKLAKF